MRHPYLLPHQQQGISLLIVMIIMLLSSLLVLGGNRVANLNEILAGSNTDEIQALEAAQMMLRDAERDIQGGTGNQRPEALRLQKSDQELVDNVRAAALAAGTITCSDGVCVNQGDAVSGDPSTSFWNNPTSLTNYQAVGATYGQWTGASAGASATANPIIAATNPARAWYWIEILSYTGTAAVWAEDCAPDAHKKFFYRITAVALGRTGTPTVVQEVFVPVPSGDGTRGCPL